MTAEAARVPISRGRRAGRQSSRDNEAPFYNGRMRIRRHRLTSGSCAVTP